MHLVLARVLRLDREEGAGAHVQRQRLPADAMSLQRLDELGREVKRRGGRGDGSVLPREHGLVIVAVRPIGGAARGDVRRQRHAPGALEEQLHRLLPFEVEQDGAIFLAVSD
jgi:hypothetical protein